MPFQKSYGELPLADGPSCMHLRCQGDVCHRQTRPRTPWMAWGTATVGAISRSGSSARIPKRSTGMLAHQVEAAIGPIISPEPVKRIPSE